MRLGLCNSRILVCRRYHGVHDTMRIRTRIRTDAHAERQVPHFVWICFPFLSCFEKKTKNFVVFTFVTVSARGLCRSRPPELALALARL